MGASGGRARRNHSDAPTVDPVTSEPPKTQGSGDPVKSETSRAAAPWTAAGAFTLGRSLTSGTAGSWWPGLIDNVRVFSGQVVAEEKIRRMCHGAEARDFSAGPDALDPTTTDGE